MRSIALPLSDIRPLLRWAAAVTVMGLLFLWWPYQPWTFSENVSVLVGWARVLAADPSGEWVFCPFVPLLSLGLAWRCRAELRAVPLQGSASGFVILLFGALVFWAGYRAGIAYPGFAAAQIILAGLIVWLCGWAWMRVLFFPWLFLVFMWPGFPLEAQLAVPMRVLAASLSAKFLGYLDLPAVSHGTALFSAVDVPNGLAEGARFKLDVAAACSGMRSLYALMMLAAFSGYWFLNRWVPRGILFLSALPLAIAGNVVRLLLLAIGTIWMGEEFAIGRMTASGEEKSGFHEFAGLAVYGVALCGMFALSSLLERSRLNRISNSAAPLATQAKDESVSATSFRASIALGFGGLLLACCAWSGSASPTVEAGVKLDLPESVGPALGKDLPMTDFERHHLPTVTLARKMYTSDVTLPTQATVVLDGATLRGLHQPEICAVAQAWRVESESRISVPIGDREVEAALMRLIVDTEDPATGRKLRRRAIHVYWYQGAHGVTAATQGRRLFESYWERAFHNSNHRWALVSFSTYLPAISLGDSDSFTENTAIADLKGFIAEIGPAILLR